MVITLGISFSSSQCDAILVRENKGRLYCIAKKSFDIEFNNKNQVLRVCDELKSLYQKRARIIIGIPLTHTMIQQITVDKGLSTKETMTFLQAQIRPLFGQHQKDVYWDYEMSIEDELRQEITLVATPKSLINSLQKIFLKNNQVVTAIEPDLFSLVRLIAIYAAEKTFYALIAEKNGFLFLSGKEGKLKQYEQIASSDSHQLSLILSTIASENRIILISMQNGLDAFQHYHALFEKHNLAIHFASIETLLQIEPIENIERYVTAIALCSWGM